MNEGIIRDHCSNAAVEREKLCRSIRKERRKIAIAHKRMKNLNYMCFTSHKGETAKIKNLLKIKTFLNKLSQ